MDFIEKNPEEEVCYLADRKNFPYGPRKKNDLSSILISLTEKIINTINPKIIALACNTATVSALEPLRQNFGKLQFVGTVPAIKPALKACKSGKIGVLGTERTINDPYIRRLLEECENGGKETYEIIGIAAPDLVEFVEQRFDNAQEEEKTEIVKKYIELFYKQGADTLVLGCTHFLYLLDVFHMEASNPDYSIKVFDSLDGVTKRIEFLLDEKNCALRARNNVKPAYRLLLTGAQEAQTSWQKRAQLSGFSLCLLDTP